MAIDVTKLAQDMLSAAKGVLTEKWPEIEDYAETEFKSIAENIAMIERMKLMGKITEEKARLHLEIQKNSARTVLLTVEGLGILAVEQAINAALGVIRDTVNSALGWTLL
ncbi:MAG: hypothetical protein HYW01_05055 [Deltaproteobacteria bacterium]|nr:hypothetical protein [Deltaproteobacteria bacterium]